MALYVDDMLILGKNLGEVECVKNEMKKLHIMKNLKSILKILEIHMMHQSEDIKINQHHYIQQVLVEFDMQHVKCSSILLSLSINLKRQDSKLLKAKDHETYQWMIDRMMFIMIETQIDIAVVVN